MLDVQAVILAGGKGTRLRPVTLDMPKPLMPIANRALVSHQLRHLSASGIRDVTLALGYEADRFHGVEQEAKELGLNIRLVVEPRPLGTGGALRWCADEGAFDDRPLLWLNGDVLATPDVGALWALHRDRQALITFWLTSARDVAPFGVLELDPDGFVERFLEKPAPEETDSHLINAGILMLDPAVLERVPSETFFSFEQGVVPNMVRGREALYGAFDGGYWLDAGRPHHYLEANRHVLEQRLDWSPAGTEVEDGLWTGAGLQIGDSARVIKPAALGDDVSLAEGAQLFGRTVLGNRVRIEEKAELEDCVLFDDVVVGAGAEIIESIVCAGARIGRDAVVRRSIVGARTVVGERNELRRARLWNDLELPRRALMIEP